MTTTPLTYYQQKLASGEILPEAQQLAVMQQFELIYQQLLQPKKKKWWWQKPARNAGIYLWGNVGIGKTFLVDTFYYALPFPDKLRMHFYSFMQEVHAELKILQGEKNPLKLLATKFAKRARVICLDELIVADIADAMVLGGLLQALLAEGICVTLTANVSPDDLYKHGLQRERFFPAIDSIKQHLRVIHLAIVDDYRERPRSQIPPTPLVQRGELLSLEEYFDYFAQGVQPSFTPLHLYDREIQVVQRAGGVVWFEFLAICSKPRSQMDYLALVQQFHTILVSNIRPISAEDVDLARNFIKFVDVLYDARTRLIISPEVSLDSIYPRGRLAFEFKRTRSRLLEMRRAM